MKSNREREKKRTVRGEITAFLSLVFVLLVSFILALTESSMIQTSKNQKRMDVDRALYSVFGEYQKDLLETMIFLHLICHTEAGNSRKICY